MSEGYDNTNKGVAWLNNKATSDRAPKFRGKGNYKGVEFEVSVWTKNKKTDGEAFLSLEFKEPYVKPQDDIRDNWDD